MPKTTDSALELNHNTIIIEDFIKFINSGPPLPTLSKLLQAKGWQSEKTRIQD